MTIILALYGPTSTSNINSLKEYESYAKMKTGIRPAFGPVIWTEGPKLLPRVRKTQFVLDAASGKRLLLRYIDQHQHPLEHSERVRKLCKNEVGTRPEFEPVTWTRTKKRAFLFFYFQPTTESNVTMDLSFIYMVLTETKAVNRNKKRLTETKSG